MTGLEVYKGTAVMAGGKKEHIEYLENTLKNPSCKNIFVYIYHHDIQKYLLTTDLRSLNIYTMVTKLKGNNLHLRSFFEIEIPL